MNVPVAVLLTLAVTILVLNLLPGAKKIRRRIPTLYGVSAPDFQRSMGCLLGPPLTAGNRASTLLNGDQSFPAMLDAIAGARRSICFETYIYWSGQIGEKFVDAISERASAGVKTHVLLDWVGSGKAKNEYLDQMKEAGAEVERYHPLHWYTLTRLNNRTHRRLLVIDGRIGFTGGIGIGEEWTGDAHDRDHWRDTHFRLEGPAVAQMQAAFMDNWLKTQAEVLHGDVYFPELSAAGDSLAQVFKSSPREGSESVELMYLLSIASARKSVLIANSYFVPDDFSVETIADASRRGVTVRIIVPGPIIDAAVTRRASRSRWGPLLEAGVEIYEYQPTMFHCKVMVVDDLWVSVGSTNFDNRSFRLNDEANLNVLDADFAREQVEIFEADRAKSRRVTLEQWKNRPLSEKFVERAAGLLRGQL
jgi:cardiolipin synthase A/B